MDISIITFADLGCKENLKTKTILPLITFLKKRNLLSQIICRMGGGFDFPHTVFALPSIFHYIISGYGKITKQFLKARLLEEKIFDFFAKKCSKKTDFVFFHPNHLAPSTLKKAKEFGSTTLGIAVTAHPLFNAQLEKEEFENLGLKKFYPKKAIWAKLAKHYTFDYQHDYLVATSEFSAKSYINMGMPPERVFVVHQDIETERFFSALKRKVKKKNKNFKALFIAYISPLKGLHYLLKAWQGLKLKNKELIIVGSYSEIPRSLKESYEKIIKKDSTIKWVGHTKKPEVYYQLADVFVFPSLSEGSPRVVMEAMATGLPVITTENAKSLVEDGKNGFVVPIRNSEAIKEKIEALYYQPELRKKMGKSAFYTIKNKKPFAEEVFKILKIISKMY